MITIQNQLPQIESVKHEFPDHFVDTVRQFIDIRAGEFQEFQGHENDLRHLIDI